MLQGIKFTENVVADPDLTSACTDASLLVFVLPHQFLGRICPQMTTMAKGCRALSLIKGIEFEEVRPTRPRHAASARLALRSLRSAASRSPNPATDASSPRAPSRACQGGPILISNMIKDAMKGMDVSVLMGANVANEVARDDFCESTVGFADKGNGEVRGGRATRGSAPPLCSRAA